MIKDELDKQRAHSAVIQATMNGTLAPVTECSCATCGNPAQEYHHDNYDDEHRLDVVPLCKSCHRKLHPKVNSRVAYLLDKNTIEIIREYAKNYEGNESLALRMLVADWRYLTAKQAALGKRPEREQETEKV